MDANPSTASRIADLARDVASTSAPAQLAALKALRELSCLAKPPTALLAAMDLAPVVALLRSGDGRAQLEAAWLLTNVAAGNSTACV
jgi:hypothetical protein